MLQIPTIFLIGFSLLFTAVLLWLCLKLCGQIGFHKASKLSNETIPIFNNNGNGTSTNYTDQTLKQILRNIYDSSGNQQIDMNETLSLVRSLPSDDIKSELISMLKSKLNNKIRKGSLHEGKKEMDLISLLDDSVANKKEWEVNIHEILFKKHIGRGGAGTTYLGSWRGQDVAVKVATMTEMGIDGWKTEIESLQHLHHENIIRLLGSIYSPPPQLARCLILEYCNAGSLERALRKSLPSTFFFRVAKGMANGLSYLHSKNILHRDIKPDNILLHGNVKKGKFIVKLNDFGLATKMHSSDEHTAEVGTYRWMAPEIIRHEEYCYKADVYSYSLVVWQLITRENPFADSVQLHAAQQVAFYGCRPPFPLGTPKKVENIISRGWSEDPYCRPTFDDLCVDLQNIEDKISKKDLDWLGSAHGHPVYFNKLLQPNPEDDNFDHHTASELSSINDGSKRRLLTQFCLPGSCMNCNITKDFEK